MSIGLTNGLNRMMYRLAFRPDSPEWPKEIKTTNLPGVVVIERPVFPDDRGCFQEIVRIPDLEKVLGQDIHIRQINKSISKTKVLRGLHIAPWGKLVHCYAGEVFQVVVDCRKDSPSFGEVFTIRIGENNSQAVWVPQGCANGLCVVSVSDAVYCYAVTETFSPGKEVGIKWDDPDLAEKINWPVKDPIVSERDRNGIFFKDL